LECGDWSPLCIQKLKLTGAEKFKSGTKSGDQSRAPSRHLIKLKPVPIKVAVSTLKRQMLMKCGGSREPDVSRPALRAATARPGLEAKAATSRRTPEFPPIYNLCTGFNKIPGCRIFSRSL
jgi:hypothetical protein